MTAVCNLKQKEMEEAVSLRHFLFLSRYWALVILNINVMLHVEKWKGIGRLCYIRRAEMIHSEHYGMHILDLGLAGRSGWTGNSVI